MSVNPGWRADYYKKLYIRQRELLSKGRIYYGNTQPSSGEEPPGNAASVKSVSRNAIYVMFLYQNAMDPQTSTSPISNFSFSVQSRFAYYDN